MHQHVHIDMLEKIKEIMHLISTEDPPSHCRDSSFLPPIIPSTDPAPPPRNKNKRESQASSEPYRVTRPRRRQPARLCRPLQLTWSSSNPCFLSRCCNTEQTVAFPVDKTMARIRVATAPGIPLCHPPESRMRSRVTEGHVPT